jgi:hypothetical protein
MIEFCHRRAGVRPCDQDSVANPVISDAIGEEAVQIAGD